MVLVVGEAHRLASENGEGVEVGAGHGTEQSRLVGGGPGLIEQLRPSRENLPVDREYPLAVWPQIPSARRELNAGYFAGAIVDERTINRRWVLYAADIQKRHACHLAVDAESELA